MCVQGDSGGPLKIAYIILTYMCVCNLTLCIHDIHCVCMCVQGDSGGPLMCIVYLCVQGDSGGPLMCIVYLCVQGDSGGPLMCREVGGREVGGRWRLAGVLSGGMLGCAGVDGSPAEGHANRFARVTGAATWIREVLSGLPGL
jgi:hypothetical protein